MERKDFAGVSNAMLDRWERDFRETSRQHLGRNDYFEAIYALSDRIDVVCEQIRRLTDETD